MKIEKQIARQDADFAINPGSNHETSIKITDDICSLFLDPLPTVDKEKTPITFFIYKEDFLRSACSIISSLPLLDKLGRRVDFTCTFCDTILSQIESFFGTDMVKAYNAELLYYTTSRNSCIQGFEKSFNIRGYLVESWSTLTFTKKTDGVHVHLLFSKDSIADTTSKDQLSLQQIFYGAPGTGKSFTIDVETEKMPKDAVFRTTFHPDSDYSTFVGAYKPTMVPVRKTVIIGQDEKPVNPMDRESDSEERIVYRFVKQAFLKAYLKAWEGLSQKVALVIEEINRGNCAQIFGDLFQLLDRKNGFSDYPIDADEDLHKTLKCEFAKIAKPSPDIEKKINELYAKHYTNALAKIWDGEIMVLPDNLYIWATMNTSDQSLYPIDSAFKRRWDWKYIKIADAGKFWKIKFDGEIITDEFGKEEIYTQDWWAFLEKINTIISQITDSADKQLGYYFCKADHGIINAESFVSKVIFYLWNDVFKDYGFDDPKLFGYKENDTDELKMLSFPDFYDNGGVVNEHIAAYFINNVMSWKKTDNKES